MTLPSSASMTIHPGNTMADYITELYQTIRLNRNYEVALAEITVPRIDSSSSALGSIELRKDEGIKKTVYFLSPRPSGELFMNFILEINKKITELTTNFGYSGTFGFEVASKYLKCNLPTDLTMIVYGELAEFLGFQRSTSNNLIPVRNESLSTDVSDRHFIRFRDFPSTLYVYTDIIDYQYVGDGYNQLLRNVFVKNTTEPQQITYSTPHYVPLLKNVLDSVQITIKDSSGELVAFKSGSEKWILKFHFRQKNGL